MIRRALQRLLSRLRGKPEPLDFTDDDLWGDEERRDLEETLRWVALGETRLAKHDRSEILEECCEPHIDDECPDEERDTFVRYAKEQIDTAAVELEKEKSTWPTETDCDRLDKAEAALRERGILLWQVSPCCDTCSHAELPERIDEIEQRHPGFRVAARGYAFFIDQNLPEMLSESSQISVYLAYGWLAPADTEVDQALYEKRAVEIGHEVVDCLTEHAFDVDWDGDLSRKIGVSLNWQRRERIA